MVSFEYKCLMRYLFVVFSWLISGSLLAQAPFTVKSDLFNQTDEDVLGLSVAMGTETYTVFKPSASTDHYSNAAAVIGFKGQLYCQWQSSKTDEDSPDTWVAYSRSANGETWSAPMVLAASPNDGYRSSGGWWVYGDTLVGYINHWPSTISPRGGYTEYVTSTDGLNWSTVKRVKMANGNDLNGIFEQDPHALPNGRIINSAHFQPGLTLSPIYTDDPSGVRDWVRPSFTNMSYTGDVTREIEPSWFYQNDGKAVMIFRDQNSSFVKLASVSVNNGQTWTTPVLTNMPDSRSKQSAGNLPDGTAFMVSNPVNNKTRIPLAVTLSADGKNFNVAYVLRKGGSDLQTQQYTGLYKTIGYSYPKSTIWNGFLYTAYTVNKEDVACTRVPLSSISLNNPCVGGTLDNCNICSGGSTGLLPCTGSMEAENICDVDGSVDNNNEGFSGSGFVNTINTIGSFANWVIYSDIDQMVTLSFRYANGGTTSRDGIVTINGTPAGNLVLSPTGSWTTWKYTSINVDLVRWSNEVIVTSTTADGLANIDVLSFSGDVTDADCQIVTTNLTNSVSRETVVFPNPTHAVIKWNKTGEWSLLNLQGQEVISGLGNRADLTELPNGYYILKIGGFYTQIIKE